MRADKDMVCRDLAGVERFVAFGSDVPAGYEYVRDAAPVQLPADATAPRSIANADAAAVHAENARARADRARRGETAVRDTLPDTAAATGEDPDAETPPGTTAPTRDYDAMNVDDLEDEVERRRAAGDVVEVTGTGKDGNVVKADLVKALQDSDGRA
jgi:hypothetical protein